VSEKFVHTLIHFAIYVLEAMFAAGIIGSALVVLLTSIEDVIEIATPEEPTQAHSQSEADWHVNQARPSGVTS